MENLYAEEISTLDFQKSQLLKKLVYFLKAKTLKKFHLSNKLNKQSVHFISNHSFL